MTSRKSVVAILLFAGSLLCFFLPFATVSCGGMKMATLSGTDFATGTTVTQQMTFGPPQSQRIPASPSAAVALLCGVAGLVLSTLGRKLASGAAACGGVGAVSLLVLENSLKSQGQQQAMGMMQVNMESGYTLALLLLIAGAGWNVFLALSSRRLGAGNVPGRDEGQIKASTSAEAAMPPPASAGHNPSQRFCTNCGLAASGARFCESCGAAISGEAPRQVVSTRF